MKQLMQQQQQQQQQQQRPHLTLHPTPHRQCSG